MTIYTKATGQQFLAMTFILQFVEIIKLLKATEQYFPVVMFIMLYKVVLSFESVDEILKYDHLNESYLANFTRHLNLFK